jgi:hypothetical protein
VLRTDPDAWHAVHIIGVSGRPSFDRDAGRHSGRDRGPTRRFILPAVRVRDDAKCPRQLSVQVVEVFADFADLLVKGQPW